MKTLLFIFNPHAGQMAANGALAGVGIKDKKQSFHTEASS